ncbi:hypothetical protein IMCC3135_09205 [Granulosicoccus antarcticus IMCC3135]|uniref:Uncharacterized protein n=1 Tax=Granulosicoccus antarcticus IMCC3135 TaxID=1192854 RepID=A0A2Z2NQJ3_9GAMM|nr:hypothetical protein IMCC3135_09205 [Granulosicoccus antarcticus IMCC3135]
MKFQIGLRYLFRISKTSPHRIDDQDMSEYIVIGYLVRAACPNLT